MGRTVVEVIKVVAPVALEALAKAAADLIAGKARSIESFKSLDVGTTGSIIFEDTTKYLNTRFSLDFNYFYKGMRSSPPWAKGKLIGATEDIIVWEPSKNSQTDISSYMTTTLSDVLSDQDTIEVASNITALFQDRFTEPDLSWSPFNKTYNMSNTNGDYSIDLEMVTAGGYDADNNPLGVATYCFVAYQNKTSSAVKRASVDVRAGKRKVYDEQ